MNPWREVTTPGPGVFGVFILLAAVAWLGWQIRDVIWTSLVTNSPWSWLILVLLVAFSIWGATGSPRK